MSSNYIEEFRSAMNRVGLVYSGAIIADKKLHRFSVDGESGNDSWYILHPDGIPAGSFGCHKNQVPRQNWHHNNGTKFSPEEFSVMKKKWADADIESKKEDAALKQRMSEKATKEVESLKPATQDHDYLKSKGILPVGAIKVNPSGDLVVPLRDIDGKIWSYQTIDFLGDKLFMPMGRVVGCFFQIGATTSGPVAICEGYATGATIHQATGWDVVCAMNCGNLEAVTAAFRKKYDKRLIVISADNDRFTKHPKTKEPWNPGLEKAQAVAKSHRAVIVHPEFKSDSDSGTDFNDLASQNGIRSVREQIYNVVGFGMGQVITMRDLLSFVPAEDENSVLGDRYLCRGGSCAIVAETSAGKSALGMQMAICFALGMDFFGLKPVRALKSIIVQAENDIGDTAEMFQGVLLGMGLVDPADPKGQADIISRLEKNLIIIRDQTHIGMDFASYASKLVEIHQPDIFWIDPMLSFYGDDINDQKAMSSFLRAQLNPISERTGIIWMLLHHTGKPAKDAKKSQSSWNSRDFNYLGIGSSELSNWARAIITVVSQGEDEFKVVFAKRGWRAKVKDDGGNPTSELHLAHSSGHICWKRIPKPKDVEDMEELFTAFARTISGSLKSSEIVRRAAAEMQRGERTVWKFWESGNGPLGVHFIQAEDGKWKARTKEAKSYVKDD